MQVPRVATLTYERLRERLDYNPWTGVFTHLRSSKGHVRAGAVAGCKAGRYTVIKLDGVIYSAHRLAWFYITGKWPEMQIDHKDGDKQNNRFLNLRDVAGVANQQNIRRARADNRLGLLGVTAHGKRFRATIGDGGKQRSIGTFDTPQQAHEAYLATKRAIHPGCTI